MDILKFDVPSQSGNVYVLLVVDRASKFPQAVIRFWPADHARGQGAVERLGGWLQEMLSELCKVWPTAGMST